MTTLFIDRVPKYKYVVKCSYSKNTIKESQGMMAGLGIYDLFKLYVKEYICVCICMYTPTHTHFIG